MAYKKKSTQSEDTTSTEVKIVEPIIYDEKYRDHINALQFSLERAITINDAPFPEFNNKTRIQYYEENEKIANTNHLDPKINSDDVIVSAGTVEQKLDSLLAHLNNLNLSTDVFAFDKDNNNLVQLGIALADIIHDTEIKDGGDSAGDEEKKIARQRELLKQGTVYVMEEWSTKFEVRKKLKEKYNGEFKDFANKWSSELVKVFEGPSRTLLYGPNVYLGDVTKFYMDEQPFIFVVTKTNYEDAKARYGKFENFKYVKKGKISFTNDSEQKSIFENKWRLTELEENQVEIIFYQKKSTDEFQILINGVCMFPIGFPLSAVSPRGNYNIVKQVFRIINSQFAFGGSFVSSGSIKEISAIIDEMLKLMVLKTRKSFMPSYINLSGRVIDRKVLSPGRISMGIDPGALVPITANEVQGVTAGESNFLEKMQSLIDKSTVSEQFTGQNARGNMTATESIQLQKQAQLTLSLAVASCIFLEKKLSTLRLYNVLENYFNPTDTKIDDAREAQVNVYRNTTRKVPIDGQGYGERSVMIQDGTLPSPEDIRNQELQTESQRGIPIRKIYISPEIKNADILWYTAINSKERESSPYMKVLFNELLASMAQLAQFGSVPNKDGLEEEFANVWGKTKNKLFQEAQPQQSLQGVSPEEAGGGSPPAPKGRSNMGGLPSGALLSGLSAPAPAQ